MKYGFEPVGDKRGLRKLNPADIRRSKTPKLMRTSVTLPSQYQAYAVCVEFAKSWFLEKFKSNYFNSVYVDGTHSFDEFRKFSTIDQQMKRANPLLAIVPTIDMTHNRQWIDSAPEIPLLLRKTSIEDSFFNDRERGLYIQLIFKTILMNFVFRVRVDTRAEELDMVEYIKLHHRAGWTESREIAIDIHVPKQIILQVAFDNGFKITENGEIEEPIKLLEYLNSHSYVPFLYKLRCSTGNKEFFIRVPNCMAHIKAELPTFDEGERQDMTVMNYIVEFQVEIEMTAPYCYTYYSQHDMPYILNAPTYKNYDKIAVMAAKTTNIPALDDHGWDHFTTTEYSVDDEDLDTCIDIPFAEFFEGHELQRLINYNKQIHVSPFIFMNFIMFNGGDRVEYDMDWDTMICHIKTPITDNNTVIAIYCDRKYINETIVYLDELDKKTARVE